MEYLDKFMTALSDPQRKELARLLGEKQESGDLLSEADAVDLIQKELEQLGKFSEEPSMKIRYQSEQTNSSNYNTTLTEINNDLKVIFSESEKIDQVLYDHHRLDKAILSNIYKSLKELSDKVESYEILIQNTSGYIQNIYETFRNKDSFDDNGRYIKDRDGVTSISSADINSATETLVLPSNGEYNRLISNSGARLATIKITDQIGQGYIASANTKNPIDNAIDGSDASFWCSVVLSDSPLTIPWRYPDGTSMLETGAACKFEIVFQSISPVSEIVLKPFTEFPIEVIGIWTYENLNRDTVGVPVISQKRTSEGTITIQFPSRECQKIEFIINQPNYTKQIYLISKSQMRNTEMWQKVYETQIETLNIENNTNPIWENNKGQSFSLENHNEYWTRFEDEFRKRVNQIKPNTPDEYIQIATDATDTSVFEKNNKKTLVCKYEYVYGMYEISIYGKTRMPVGAYVSKPIITKGNIRQASLNALEESMYLRYNDITGQVNISNDGTDTNRFIGTSVEWYISPKEEPNTNEWFPILPLEVKLDDLQRPCVDCELLIPDENGICCTRFPIVPTAPIAIRKNGIPIPATSYTIGNFGSLTNQQVTLSPYIQSDSYSIEYRTIPVTGNGGKDDFRVIDFSDPYLDSMTVKPVRQKDIFTTGTNRRKAVSLSYYPYVDYEKINTVKNTPGLEYNPNVEANDCVPPIKISINDGKKTYLPAFTDDDNDADDTDAATGKTKATDRTYNRTDYLEGTKEILMPYDSTHQIYDYRQDKQEIVFANEWPSGTVINIDYFYQVSRVRVKAILRRVVPGFDSITPVVQSYSLKLRAVNRV